MVNLQITSTHFACNVVEKFPPSCELYFGAPHMTINMFRLSGLSNLTSLSLRKSYAVTAEGMRAMSGLHGLSVLDLEGCSGVHGGLVHLKGL